MLYDQLKVEIKKISFKGSHPLHEKKERPQDNTYAMHFLWPLRVKSISFGAALHPYITESFNCSIDLKDYKVESNFRL